MYQGYEDDLYLYALELFKASGNAVTSDVFFANHTPEQFIFFDCPEVFPFSKVQRQIIKNVSCISHLFDIEEAIFEDQAYGGIGFYSMEMLCAKPFRSQTAYDIHCLFQRVFPTKASVILFRHNNDILLSMQGFNSDVYLSDWFDQECDFNFVADRIDVLNMSFSSAKEYFYDFVYSVARWYYIYPITKEEATYSMLALDYLLEADSSLDFNRIDREKFKSQVCENLRLAELEYGEDYVEQESIWPVVNFNAELELLALELDKEEDVITGQDDELEEDFEEKDEYELDNIDADIFQDPILMIKFLEKNV